MIESALGWIGDLARFLGSLLPRLMVVQASHRAVKYVRGRRVVLLEPGVHVYWPIVTPIEFCAVVRQVKAVPTQVLETADDQTVAVSGVVEFEIVDPIAFLARTEDGWNSAVFLAAAAIRRVVMKHDRDDLCDAPEATDLRLTRQAQRWLAPYGVRVLRLRLADFARVRPIHLTGIPQRADPHAEILD